MESLKLAVRTPQTRVALCDPAGVERAVIRRISWTGGFLDGVSIPISTDLTTLIGGRGTGKSTVIESLRYALDLVPIGEDAAIDHKSIVDKVLRSGTVVKVDVETVSPTPHRYTIERVVPHPPIVRDSAGTATRQLPEDVIDAVEIFGQHELAELAGSPERVAEMLQRFSGVAGRSADHQNVLDNLAENRAQLQRAEKARAKLEQELDDIPRLEEQVKRFRETKVAERLKDQNRLTQDEAVFKEAEGRVADAAGEIGALVDSQLFSDLTAEYESIDGSPQKAFLDKASTATNQLAGKLRNLAKQALAAIGATTAELSAVEAEWHSAVSAQRKGHDEVLRKLHEEGLEPDKYLDTSKALDALRAKRPRLDSHDTTLKQLRAKRAALLGELADYERLQTKRLHDAVRAANSATEGMVVVRPIAAPDREEIRELVKKRTSGVRTQINAAIGADDFSPRALAAAIRDGDEALEKLGIRGAQARSLLEAGEQPCRELEEVTVGHAVEVLLDVSSTNGPRELRTLEELSKGQRATALLLLLLGASKAPLVIDQPEDDLDNRFIYDGVVAHLRELKGERQIIASTHNANVPVLGDAELIVALEGRGDHGQIAADGVGSLDDAAIRNLVENLLEGGPAAFNARQHLYGF